MGNCEHPNGLYYTSRPTKKSFSVESYLSVIKPEENEMPYAVHGHFSRYKFAIMDPTKTPGSATGNMSAKEWPSFLKRANATLDMLAIPVQKMKEQESSPAYTETLGFGEYKGKSPAAAILEGGEKAVESLKGAYKILKQNAEKYPANKKKMDAIAQAVKLYQEGKLSADDADISTTEIPLSLSGPRALTRKEEKDGKKPVYELNIYCHPNDLKAPYEVVIKSCYAPVIKSEDGRIQPKLSEAIDRLTYNFSLAYDEMADLVSRIEVNLNQFSMLTASTVFKMAAKYDAENRKAVSETAAAQ